MKDDRAARTALGLGPVDISRQFDEVNPDYYRQIAYFEVARRLLRPVRLVVKNVGQAVADSVRVEIVVPVGDRVRVLDSADVPATPKRRRSRFTTPDLGLIRPAFLRKPGDVHIDRNADRYRVEIDCGSLQPGRRVWSEKFHLGVPVDGQVTLAGEVFAGNLPRPKPFSLSIDVELATTEMSVAEIRALPDPPGASE